MRWAAGGGHINVVNRLLEIPAVRENAADSDNEALVLAARNGHNDVALALAEAQWPEGVSQMPQPLKTPDILGAIKAGAKDQDDIGRLAHDIREKILGEERITPNIISFLGDKYAKDYVFHRADRYGRDKVVSRYSEPVHAYLERVKEMKAQREQELEPPVHPSTSIGSPTVEEEP